jgi:hypothetical protein
MKCINFSRQRKRTYFAAKIEEGESGIGGYASPAFSISHRQAKEMATNYGCHLSNVLSFSFNIG